MIKNKCTIKDNSAETDPEQIMIFRGLIQRQLFKDDESSLNEINDPKVAVLCNNSKICFKD